MALTHKDVRHILDLLDRCGNLETLEIKSGEVSISARRSGAAVAAAGAADGQPEDATSSNGASARATVVTEAPDGVHAVRAPMNGVFYARPSPEDPPFVNAGDEVTSDQPVCLVEAMKLFNSVDAGAVGTIRDILVENGTQVERDQILILIEPKAG